jgi:hypothetical protein
MFEDGSYAASSGGEDWGVGEAEVGVETCLLTARQFILFTKGRTLTYPNRPFQGSGR